jgi:alpha-glucosidase
MGVCKDFSEPYAPHEELLKLRQKLLDTGNEDKHPFWDRDEVFEVYKEWRKVFDEYDPPLT